MAWTSPRTWVTAEMVTAAMLNTYVRDNLQSIRDQVACRIHRSAAAGTQSIPNGGELRIDMDTIDFDTTGTIADLANDRLMIPVSGKYVIGGNGRFAAATGGHREIRIYYHDTVANLDVRVTFDASEGAAGVAPCLSMDTAFDCKAGDYVYFTMFQNQGAALNMTVLEPTDPCIYLFREGI